MIIIISWFGCAIASSVIALMKNRSAILWFFLGALLGPIGLIISLVIDSGNLTESERKCPFCAEMIKSEAIICKHCGKDVAISLEELPRQKSSFATLELTSGILVFCVIVAIIVLGGWALSVIPK